MYADKQQLKNVWMKTIYWQNTVVQKTSSNSQHHYGYHGVSGDRDVTSDKIPRSGDVEGNRRHYAGQTNVGPELEIANTDNLRTHEVSFVYFISVIRTFSISCSRIPTQTLIQMQQILTFKDMCFQSGLEVTN